MIGRQVRIRPGRRAQNVHVTELRHCAPTSAESAPGSLIPRSANRAARIPLVAAVARDPPIWRKSPPTRLLRLARRTGRSACQAGILAISWKARPMAGKITPASARMVSWSSSIETQSPMSRSGLRVRFAAALLRFGQSAGCQRRNVAPWSSTHSAISPYGMRLGSSARPPAARTRSTAAAMSSTR